MPGARPASRCPVPGLIVFSSYNPLSLYLYIFVYICTLRIAPLPVFKYPRHSNPDKPLILGSPLIFSLGRKTRRGRTLFGGAETKDLGLRRLLFSSPRLPFGNFFEVASLESASFVAAFFKTAL